MAYAFLDDELLTLCLGSQNFLFKEISKQYIKALIGRLVKIWS